MDEQASHRVILRPPVPSRPRSRYDSALTSGKRQVSMTTDNKKPEKIERRDFLKKTGTGTVAGMIAAGFPAIISGQSVTNSLKLGLVGCGGRGSGAAAQALTAGK